MINRWNALSQRTQDALLISLIALTALLPRLFGLTTFLTADEPKSWFGRAIQFLDALARGDFIATFDSPAPGVTTMWSGSIGLLLDYARQGFPGDLVTFLGRVPFDPLDPAILPLIRLPIVLAALLAALLTYVWGRDIFGRWAALLAALFLALDPFLLALTRILGHDGLVTLFMWLSLLAFLRAMYRTEVISRQFLAVSGIYGGLAFLTKYPSLFLGAFIALVLLIEHQRRPAPRLQSLRRWAIDVAVWSLAAGVVFVLLWPAMWVDPVGRVVAIFSDALRASGSPHQKGSFFFGQPVADPGASFYPIVTLFKTTPVLWLGWLLLALSFIPNLRRKQEPQVAGRNSRSAILILLAFAFAFALLVTIGGKKQDRYILPVFPALATLAALGYTRVQLVMGNKKLVNWFSRVWVKPALLAGVVAVHALFVLPTHPYYFSYYNPLLGGGPAASQIIIVGWGEGLDEAARWLNQQPDGDQLDIVAWYSTTFEPYFEGNAIYKIDEEKISRTAKPGLAADYVVLYVNQLQRELPTLGALQFFRAEPPAHVVTLNGADYAWIYPSISLQRVIADESRLVGQAELQGYNLLDEQGQRVETLAADRATTIELYWEWQGKAADEPIGLALVDDAGRAWGWGHPLGTQARYPFEQWQEGMVAHDDFVLEVFAGTPPGQYWLKSWIDRPATGERVGDFPITAEMQVTVERPAGPPAIDQLPVTTWLDALFLDGSISFLGLDGGQQFAQPWQPGQQRDLTLYWHANRPVSKSQVITLSLIDEDGRMRHEWSAAPVQNRFPFNHWQPGDIVRDPWQLELPAYVPPGAYRLTTRLGPEGAVDLLTTTVAGRPRQFDLPPIDLPLGVQFDNPINLLGLQTPADSEAGLQIEAGQPLEFSLVWQARGLVPLDYTVTAQLLDGEQQVLAQRDTAPLGGAAPTSSWTPGEILIDPVTLELPPALEDGPYRLLIALYQPETGQRLHLSDGSDHLTIPVVSRVKE